MTRLTSLATALVTLGALTAAASAQWSTSTTSPLRIGEQSSDIPTVRATADGGAFVAWQQTQGSFYNSIHIQRLSPAGVEMWGHGGIIAVPGTNSATFVGDFDIAIASDGNLLLVNSITNADPAAPTVRQAVVQKFDAATGSPMWNVAGGGVRVSSGALGGWPAYVCAMPDGGCVVTYHITVNPTTETARFMRYTPAGAPAWAGPKAIVQPDGFPVQNTKIIPTCVQPAGGGSFIVSWIVSRTQSELHAQKFDGNGVADAGWGTAGTGVVLDSHGLTNRDFPRFQPDGLGGAVFFWRTYANAGFGACADAVVQHVLPGGGLKFPSPVASVDHTFVPCGTEPGGPPGQGQFTAAGAFTRDPSSGAFTYFIGAAQGPSASGSVKSVIVQKLSDAGNRLWAPGGYTVVPQSSNPQVGPNHVNVTATSDGGCMVFGSMGRGFTTINGIVFAVKVVDSGGAGAAAWDKILDSDATTGKGRMAAVTSAGSDDAIVVWTRSGSTMYAGRVNATTGAPGVVAEAPSLDVDLPPTILVCAGDTVQLSVQASGTPGISYQWQRHYAYNVAANPDAYWNLTQPNNDFQCVLPATGTTYAGFYSPTLTITNIQPNDPTAACPNSDPLLNEYRVIMFNAGSDGFNNPASVTSSVVRIEFSDLCGGVCCRGSTCSIQANAGACTPSGAAGASFSAGSTCNAAGNNTGPCCKADYNKANGVELLDIFAFLNDWFGNVQWADFNAQNNVDLLDIFAFLSAWFAGGC